MEHISSKIRRKATGDRIWALMDENNLAVSDIQEAMGFDYPQAVYNWLDGKSLPSLEHILVLSIMLHTNINEILVYDEDFDLYKIFFVFFPIHF